MKRLIIGLLLFAVSYFATSAVFLPIAINGGTISISAIASRGTSGDPVSCYVPCAIFFDATGTTSTLTSIPFHEIEYRWDFGDSGAGTWANGSRPGVSSKNAATGATVAHLFDIAGPYTVVLSAFDGFTTKTLPITVTAVAWPDDTNTVCACNTSSFTGCPASATHAANSSVWGTVFANITGSKKRLLLCRGGTWTAAANTNFTSVATGPGMIGTYGSGALPKLQITTTAVSPLNFSQDATASWGDWRIADLEIDGGGFTNTIGIQGSGTAYQLTFARLNIHNIEDAINFSDDALNLNTFPVIWDQVNVTDTTITTIIGGAGGNGLYLPAARMSVNGNLMDDSTAGEFPMRLPYVGKGSVSNNTFSRPAVDKSNFTIRSTTTSLTRVYAPGTTTNYVMVSDNYAPGASNPYVVGIGTANDLSPEDAHNFILERNWIKNGVGSQRMIIYGFSDVTIRDNLFDFTGPVDATYSEWTSIEIAKHAVSVTPTPNNIRIYNNTAYSDNSRPMYGFLALSDQFSITNVIVKNNLVYAPSASPHEFLCIVAGCGAPGTGYDASNNSTTAQIAGTNPNFTSTSPFNPTNAKPAGGSYAIGGGILVPVWSDFFLQLEPSPRDMGAVNH